MKKIRNYLFLFVCVSLIMENLKATSYLVEHQILFAFNPTITPAPKLVIPYTAIVSPTFIVNNALNEFKNTTRSEKKEKIKAVKATLKEFKANNKAGNEPSTNQLLMVILAILLPPLAVYLHEGEVNTKFWISLLLTLLLWLPGVIYALLVVLGEV
jgi:uncharacterized membrane protein YqaE (UPF0057 family)